ncbi:hypothetical protein V5799_020006 [Amblyomma americanum]|uniref:Uncharacterized protein n=1 Tax=Amblyomma americanum TaxID=6943 RepID=A0AAQ4EV16_AMBAM
MRPTLITAVVVLLRLAEAQLSYWHVPARSDRPQFRDVDEVMNTLSNRGYAALVNDDEEDTPIGRLHRKLALLYVAQLNWSVINIEAVNETFRTGITTPETCTSCEFVMDILKKNSGTFSRPLFVAFLWALCYMQTFTTTEVCTGIVKTYNVSVALAKNG